MASEGTLVGLLVKELLGLPVKAATGTNVGFGINDVGTLVGTSISRFVVDKELGTADGVVTGPCVGRFIGVGRGADDGADPVISASAIDGFNDEFADGTSLGFLEGYLDGLSLG